MNNCKEQSDSWEWILIAHRRSKNLNTKNANLTFCTELRFVIMVDFVLVSGFSL
jgi:hypothetical protein